MECRFFLYLHPLTQTLMLHGHNQHILASWLYHPASSTEYLECSRQLEYSDSALVVNTNNIRCTYKHTDTLAKAVSMYLSACQSILYMFTIILLMVQGTNPPSFGCLRHVPNSAVIWKIFVTEFKSIFRLVNNHSIFVPPSVPFRPMYIDR